MSAVMVFTHNIAKVLQKDPNQYLITHLRNLLSSTPPASQKLMLCITVASIHTGTVIGLWTYKLS